ncbi:MAG TPA: PP2C family protein-serine/threonine phosphatase [Thermoanaerobaculia bacterium]|nr:PP2C family protein-serine/threonine phosphatase [Thermoanaerobaculia bacterium]
MHALSSRGGVAGQLRLFAVPPTSPRDIDVHAVSQPARQFTGDFYFTHREGSVLWIVLGDVAGKGLEAAVIMAMIQEQLEERLVACVRASTDPANTMTRLHLALRELLPGNRFATAVIAQIHDDGRLVVTNAGHCPLLIARRNGSIETIGSTGPVIGILPSAHWRSIELPFRRGDALLAYTDGVIEAGVGNGEELGLCRLQETFAAAAAQATRSRDIAAAIESMLDSFASRREDDVTFVVARR